MRVLLVACLVAMAGIQSANASEQQCEALAKPINAKMAELQNDDMDKPTPDNCRRASELIKLYEKYKSQADSLNCGFVYVSGKKIGAGAPERAELLAEMKKAYKEECR